MFQFLKIFIIYLPVLNTPLLYAASDTADSRLFDTTRNFRLTSKEVLHQNIIDKMPFLYDFIGKTPLLQSIENQTKNSLEVYNAMKTAYGRYTNDPNPDGMPLTFDAIPSKMLWNRVRLDLFESLLKDSRPL